MVRDALTEHDVPHSDHLSVRTRLFRKPLLSQSLAAGSMLDYLTAEGYAIDPGTGMIAKPNKAACPLFRF
jgi:hypothetical protein